MAFFPLSSAINTNGFCTVHNFPPNQWELGLNSRKSLWAIYSDSNNWQTEKLDDFEVGESKTYYYNDLSKLNKIVNSLILLQFNPLFTLFWDTLRSIFGRFWSHVWSVLVSIFGRFWAKKALP